MQCHLLWPFLGKFVQNIFTNSILHCIKTDNTYLVFTNLHSMLFVFFTILILYLLLCFCPFCFSFRPVCWKDLTDHLPHRLRQCHHLQAFFWLLQFRRPNFSCNNLTEKKSINLVSIMTHYFGVSLYFSLFSEKNTGEIDMSKSRQCILCTGIFWVVLLQN